MTKSPRLQPVYVSINKPLTIGGADRRMFFVALMVAAQLSRCSAACWQVS